MEELCFSLTALGALLLCSHWVIVGVVSLTCVVTLTSDWRGVFVTAALPPPPACVQVGFLLRQPGRIKSEVEAKAVEKEAQVCVPVCAPFTDVCLGVPQKYNTGARSACARTCALSA